MTKEMMFVVVMGGIGTVYVAMMLLMIWLKIPLFCRPARPSLLTPQELYDWFGLK